MHPVESIIQTTMSQLKGIVDVNTIVGDPIYSEGNTLVFPVSKISVGFLSGGGEYERKGNTQLKNYNAESGAFFPFAGTAVAGVSVTPKAFISVHDGQMKVTPAEFDTTLDRLVEMIPGAICQVQEAIQAAKGKQKEPADESEAEQ
ncbi:MAG: sporulation protein YtfJ [Clostridiales bacterium]|nr:sporulation protein YtfJ [Clostridiales bacterium]